MDPGESRDQDVRWRGFRGRLHQVGFALNHDVLASRRRIPGLISTLRIRSRHCGSHKPRVASHAEWHLHCDCGISCEAAVTYNFAAHSLRVTRWQLETGTLIVRVSGRNELF